MWGTVLYCLQQLELYIEVLTACEKFKNSGCNIRYFTILSTYVINFKVCFIIQLVLPPGAVNCWVFLSCMEVLTACEKFKNSGCNIRYFTILSTYVINFKMCFIIQLVLPPGAVNCWVFLSCMEVLTACEKFKNSGCNIRYFTTLSTYVINFKMCFIIQLVLLPGAVNCWVFLSCMEVLTACEKFKNSGCNIRYFTILSTYVINFKMCFIIQLVLPPGTVNCWMFLSCMEVLTACEKFKNSGCNIRYFTILSTYVINFKMCFITQFVLPPGAVNCWVFLSCMEVLTACEKFKNSGCNIRYFTILSTYVINFKICFIIQLVLPPGAINCWVFLSCMEVLTACEKFKNSGCNIRYFTILSTYVI